MRIVTWNMQGAGDSVESKWVKAIGRLLASEKANIDVLCLQECGMPPPTANIVAPPGWSTEHFPAPPDYRFCIWEPGNNAYDILWVETDPNGHRVNMAICSKIYPDSLLFAPPGLPAHPRSRPAIGIALGATFIFTLHGISPGGPDVPNLMVSIDGAMQGLPWYAAGDFNCEPGTWAPPPGILVWPPNKVTYPASGLKLDYMAVKTDAMVIESGEVLTQFNQSDHYPVAYEL